MALGDKYTADMHSRLLLSLLFATATFAADKVDLNGKCQVAMSVGGTDREQTCAFTHKETELTGSCQTDNGTVQINGKVEEKKISWAFRSEYNGSPLTVAFSGTMESDNKIRGRVSVEEFGVEGEFLATQAK